MIDIGCYIPCRDDSANLNTCVNALLNQTLKPKQIVVLNDGSDDEVNELGDFYGFKPVNLPGHEKSYVGSPEMAILHNVGLKILDEIDSYDYVLVLGADNILPPHYLMNLANSMKNDDVVVGSGLLSGENTHDVRGGGRLIDYSFFKSVGLQYPVNYGWESWILFKARSMNRQCKVYPLYFDGSRRTHYVNRGKDMRALGYDFRYALGRCFLLFFKSPLTALKTLFTYLFSDVERLDVADFVKTYQRKEFWRRLNLFE